jgi:anti-sigma factor RsiW
MPQHVTRLLTAYVHDELPSHLRERVARHVQVCDQCYARLRRERDLVHTIEAQLPAMGFARQDQLSRLLPGILADGASQRVTQASGNLKGFGLALVVSVLLIMLVPALIMPHVGVVAAPDQPAPYMIAATATQSVTDAPAVYVVVSPTAIAARNDAATEPPLLNPSPVPVMQVENRE